MYQNDPTKVLTCEVRLSYANLINPRKINENDPNEKAKYSVTLLIPKTEQNCINDIMQSMQAAADAAVNSVWGGFVPQYAPIIHDGDQARPDGTPYGEECKGCWVLTASSVNKPQVVHQSNISAELAPADIYSGMYARVTIRFYGYNNRAKGVACGLGNIMKTRDGEPLAGGASAAADFAGLEQASAPIGAVPQTAGVPTAQATQQQQYAQPQYAQQPAPNYANQAFPQQSAPAVQYPTGQYGA
jgi:hypothetical protein